MTIQPTNHTTPSPSQEVGREESLYLLPPEWYPQRGVQLTWPHADTDWAPYLDDITATMINLTAAIARHEEVYIVTPSAQATRAQIEAILPDDLTARIHYYEMPTNDTWARDHGAITLIQNSKSKVQSSKFEVQSSKFKVQRHKYLNFRFNGWGEKFPAELDNAINSHLSDQGFFDAPLTDNEDFVLEGGSIESDGKGTIFTTAQCLLAPHRNQPLSQEEITEELKRRLHAERIIWLHHGNLIGDDTDGHIDTIVRVAPDDTLLYMGCDDPTDAQYDDLKALEEELKTLRTIEGKPYRLIKLPSPYPIQNSMERLPATYANFLVINDAVIVPTYDQEDNDLQAMRLIAQAFPGRFIEGIDARTIIRQHGSIHCLTMQYPS